jgi:hypothetical protein
MSALAPTSEVAALLSAPTTWRNWYHFSTVRCHAARRERSAAIASLAHVCETTTSVSAEVRVREMRDELPVCCAFQPSAMVEGSGVLNDLLPPFTTATFNGQFFASLQV